MTRTIQVPVRNVNLSGKGADLCLAMESDGLEAKLEEGEAEVELRFMEGEKLIFSQVVRSVDGDHISIPKHLNLKASA
jgi:hypothetical protein